MKKPKKTTAKNLKARAEALVAYILEGDKEGIAFGCEVFDDMCDTLMNEDYFGTEGQNDPRGDWRD